LDVEEALLLFKKYKLLLADWGEFSLSLNEIGVYACFWK
jgi:hypothetical protein